MRPRPITRALLCLAPLVICGASQGRAQSFEQAGVRAQGMGGAFVAVADDASAVWWNPAGLAGGPFFNILLERQSQTHPDEHVAALAVATPPLGISYQRLEHALAPATQSTTGRQTTSDLSSASSLVTHETGVTLLQSVAARLVVGSSLKFLRGIVNGRGTNQFDLDIGAHYRSGPLAVGVVVRNLLEPTFRTPEGADVNVDRHVRAGVAWLAGVSTTVAADLDVTEPQDGARAVGRRLALGAEQRFGLRWAVRGGMRLRTSGAVDPWGSVGASFAVRPGIWVDGFWGRGEEQDGRWGVAGRVSY